MSRSRCRPTLVHHVLGVVYDAEEDDLQGDDQYSTLPLASSLLRLVDKDMIETYDIHPARVKMAGAPT